jgi:hypothetical protein
LRDPASGAIEWPGLDVGVVKRKTCLCFVALAIFTRHFPEELVERHLGAANRARQIGRAKRTENHFGEK